MDDSVDERAHRVGRRQLGLATRKQLREVAGVSPSTITRRLRSGRWTEQLPPVIDLRTHPPSWRRSLQQLVLAAGPEAWVSHCTAAYLHGFLDVPRPDHLDVLVLRGRHDNLRGLRLHTTVSLGADELTVVEGLPCTSRARTLVDLAAGACPSDLERVALDLGRRDVGALTRAVDLLDRRRGVPGRRRLLDVLAGLPGDVGVIGSPLEVRGVQALAAFDLPAPRLQYRVRDLDGAVIKRVDAAWPDARVAVEFDGGAYHDLVHQKAEDARARGRMRALGWEVIVLRSRDLDGPALEEAVRRIRLLAT